MADTLKTAKAFASKSVLEGCTVGMEACADIAKSVGGVAQYVRREHYWVLGVTAYLMTSFVTGNVMSAVYNIYRHSIA